VVAGGAPYFGAAECYRGTSLIRNTPALWQVVHPTLVLLNRGNHEDEVVGRAYGFFDEVSVCVCTYI